MADFRGRGVQHKGKPAAYASGSPASDVSGRWHGADLVENEAAVDSKQMLRGREFTEADDANPTPGFIVNERPAETSLLAEVR